MSTYKAVRGKEVHLGRIHLTVDAAGTLTIMVLGEAGDEVIELPEPVASEVYNLLGDVMVWESSKGVTENHLDQMGEAESASGELDDDKAASNK